MSNFWGWFFQLFVGKKIKIIIIKTLKRPHTKVTQNEVKKKKKNLGRIFWGVKIGYHSNFNPECNTKRGCNNQLYIKLGLEVLRSLILVWKKLINLVCRILLSIVPYSSNANIQFWISISFNSRHGGRNHISIFNFTRHLFSSRFASPGLQLV